MTTKPVPTALTLRVGEALRDARTRQGLSAPEVARRCADLGVPIPPTAINKIETAGRGSLKVEEILAFAAALNVPVASLLVPLGAEPTIDLLPNLRLSPWEAVQLITGEGPLADESEGSPRFTLAMFREHEVDVQTATISTRAARDWREQAGKSSVGSDRYDQLTRQAAEMERIAREDCRRLLETRQRMRDRGLHPAPLPEHLTFIAQEEEVP
ncbi:helix-turn-helix transcriptional regulator [Kitasatospora sp. YST-16]|uniref:helix-turn-helix domain-containing protein n=1 Tax=Kitasatospora sp. YST-16 TaxID=2998080 RepID=UPI00228447D2|nr:helix-turn-helix transcriptional regulator [Kitasatospora sp. YST-16]WAL74510.1 helix-turn-helix transcriptional regulator [Kitasatospora sp. YST-16]WNW40572.1 helix-turn-helix transcriptional regulator [Streptomyces sp. Li-HN-5-13]